MDAQQFLAEFGHIANAPGGVEQLRKLVLHLAVTGDLISTDAPLDASPLLDVIETQKREHPDRKKVIAKQAPISRAEIKAPPHWAVCRIGDLALTITGGGTPSKNHPAYWNGSIPWASVKDLKALKFIDDTEDHITESGLKNSSSNLIPPGRAIVCTRMGLGKIAINHVDLAINQDLKALELPEEVNIDFFLILYKTREVKGTGTTVSGIKQNQLLALPAALPPLEEQSLIVARVDELMALCDKLEAQQQTRRTLQNALRQSTLQAVASANSPHELETSWTRLANNFGRLFHTPEDVKELRNLVFQLGIQGLIVDQCETDSEKAIAFIRSVQTKKDRLVTSGVIRRTTSFPSVEEREEPFTLPRGWVFCRLGEVSICRDGQRIPLSKAEREPRRGEFPYYGASGIIDHIDDFIFEEDLLLVGEDGANLVNRSTPIAFIATGRYWVNNHAHVLDTVNGVALRYLELYINAIDLKPYVTGTAQPKMNQEKMNLIVVAVPPPEEQARIVECIDKLMRFCDTLEKAFFNAVKTAERVAISAVANVTGIAIEQEEEPMKAPQTELFAPLRLGTSPDIKAQAPLATILARHNGEMGAKDLWQRFGGEIDAFYAQLKTEVAHGWILEPAPAEMREKPDDTVRA